jgi:hypothetical protein
VHLSSPRDNQRTLLSLKKPRNYYSFGVFLLLLEEFHRQAVEENPCQSELLGYCNTAITSDIYTHIFKEYKARMAESIEKDLI